MKQITTPAATVKLHAICRPVAAAFSVDLLNSSLPMSKRCLSICSWQLRASCPFIAEPNWLCPGCQRCKIVNGFRVRHRSKSWNCLPRADARQKGYPWSGPCHEMHLDIFSADQPVVWLATDQGIAGFQPEREILPGFAQPYSLTTTIPVARQHKRW